MREPRETDIGQMARNVARARLILLLVFCGVALAVCLYAAGALALALLWNAAQGR
jgi:uncharacterized protein involved in exopolysaccharide biosynthesis